MARQAYSGTQRPDIVAFAIFPADGSRSAAINAGRTTVTLADATVISPGIRGKRKLSATLRNENGEPLAQSVYIESDQPVVLFLNKDAQPVRIEGGDPTLIPVPTRGVAIQASVAANIRLVFSIYEISLVRGGVAAGTAPGTGPTVITQGQTVVGVVATVLRAALAISQVTVLALTGNPAQVFVGNAGVLAANGFPLQPGDSITIRIDDISKVFVIAAAAGNSVAWLAEGNV